MGSLNLSDIINSLIMRNFLLYSNEYDCPFQSVVISKNFNKEGSRNKALLYSNEWAWLSCNHAHIFKDADTII